MRVKYVRKNGTIAILDRTALTVQQTVIFYPKQNRGHLQNNRNDDICMHSSHNFLRLGVSVLRNRSDRKDSLSKFVLLSIWTDECHLHLYLHLYCSPASV